MQQVNLFPVASRQRTLFRRQLRKCVVMWLITAGGLAVGFFWLDQAYRRERAALEETRSSVAHLRAAAEETQRLRNESTALRRTVHESNRIQQPDLLVSLLQLIAESVSRQQNLHLESLRIEEGGAITWHDSAWVLPPKQITLSGATDDDLKVSSLVRDLRATGVFSTVQLVNSQAQSDGHNAKRSFQIKCEF